MEKYPFQLSYITKHPIWGGTRLPAEFSRKSDKPTVGESWELSVREGDESLVCNGIYAGKTLRSLLAQAKREGILQNDLASEFPLLIKYIDAADNLSVQVHPDNSYAARVENDRGKTEMWYIVDAEEGAELILGLNDGVDREALAAALEKGGVEALMHRQRVKAGDCYFIPAGMVHAIGRGILVAEIQQNCDLTYRLYDYNRRQADGSLRELHIEKSLDVSRCFTAEEIEAIRYARSSRSIANGEPLADCEYFRVERLTAKGSHALPACSQMRHILCYGGKGELLCDGARYPIAKGDSYFLLPDTDVAVEGELEMLVSST